MIVKESAIERHLVKRVAEYGGVAEKFVSPGKRNVPDRLVQWPSTFICRAEAHFVETKAPKKGPTPAQKRDHERRRAMGFSVYALNTKRAVDEYVAAQTTRLNLEKVK